MLAYSVIKDRYSKIGRPPWLFIEVVICLCLIVAVPVVLINRGGEALLRTKVIHSQFYFWDAKAPVDFYWRLFGRFPDDIERALARPELVAFRENEIYRDASTGVYEGTRIFDAHYPGDGSITFKAMNLDTRLDGQKITFRPAIEVIGGVHTLRWICGYAEAPEGAVVIGVNHTTMSNNVLPIDCRGKK